MKAFNFAIEKADSIFLAGLESDKRDVEYLKKRSFELLNKFRKVWNEVEYQEWCTIQRLLHKLT
ncbi:hypothetical protein [Sphingobacterium sp. LRF_L2]|uniref:hypothetical protein n=1 Tax=Sphingobacterium sp. LRF_L2 TaxID=3369421 RepID=UPI003F625ADA